MGVQRLAGHKLESMLYQIAVGAGILANADAVAAVSSIGEKWVA